MKNMEFILYELSERYPQLKVCIKDVRTCCDYLLESVINGRKILLCGNGGSSADCDHIAGELLKGFLLKRPLNELDRKKLSQINGNINLADRLQYGVCAIPLHAMSAMFTAYCNDVEPTAVFAQTVFAMGKPGDCLICISTSGNAENVYYAAVAAKAFGIHVIGLTGQNESKLSEIADICIRVPEIKTFKIQELHLPVYHAICAIIESELYGTEE